jgi:hypothetical protein
MKARSLSPPNPDIENKGYLPGKIQGIFLVKKLGFSGGIPEFVHFNKCDSLSTSDCDYDTAS